MSTFINRDKSKYYADSITRVTDPFWKCTCGGCGHTYLSCIAISNCPTCGCPDAERFLGETPYDEVIAERSEPKMSFASKEAERIYYGKSE